MHFHQVKRREFITLIGGMAAWLLAARAQSTPVRPLIGVLSPLSAAAAARNIATFRSALRDLGYVERNVTLALRFGDGVPERMPPLARELAALNPDVIVAASQSGGLAAHNATRTIPLVVLTFIDPVASGFAQSIARPGGNITGTTSFNDDALVGKQLDLLKLALPGLVRVGAIFNPDDPTDAVRIPRLPAAAQALGMAMKLIAFRDASQLDAVAAEVMHAGVQALLFGGSPLSLSARTEITTMVERLKLPAIYDFRDYVEAGGLMSYGINLLDNYRLAARLVGRILKGANPGDLPFEVPTRYELIVNLKTAKAIGLTVPDKLLVAADEVIE
jgi:putative ABC transport system substrate-binding protein